MIKLVGAERVKGNLHTDLKVTVQFERCFQLMEHISAVL